MFTLSTASCPLQSAGAGTAGIPLTDTSWQREAALNLFQTRVKVLLTLRMQISLLEMGAEPRRVPASSFHFALPFTAAAARFLTATLVVLCPRGGTERPQICVCEERCGCGACSAWPNGRVPCARAAPKPLLTSGDHKAFRIQLQSTSMAVLLHSAELLWIFLHRRNELCSVGSASPSFF